MIERAAGKRIDPKTKGYYKFFPEFFSWFIISADVYHITWNFPSSNDVQERLVQLEENSEKLMISRLKEYRRYRYSFIIFGE